MPHARLQLEGEGAAMKKQRIYPPCLSASEVNESA